MYQEGGLRVFFIISSESICRVIIGYDLGGFNLDLMRFIHSLAAKERDNTNEPTKRSNRNHTFAK